MLWAGIVVVDRLRVGCVSDSAATLMSQAAQWPFFLLSMCQIGKVATEVKMLLYCLIPTMQNFWLSILFGGLPVSLIT